MPRSTPHYIIRDPDRLNLRFYLGFDHKFLYRKAQTLLYLFDQREQFKKMIKKTEEQSENADNEYLTSQDIDDKYFEGLKAEVYFTEMHQFESLFALLLALFQELPHWLYLTTYRPGEIRQATLHFLNGNVAAITNGKVESEQDFILDAIYAGFPLNEESRNATLENIGWFLKQVGRRYIDASGYMAGEYNAYKHGLRVLTGPSQLSMRMNDASGTPQGPTFVLGASNDSLSFLELEDKGEEGTTVMEVTKHFNPEENFLNLYMMQALLGELKKTRLACIKGEPITELMTVPMMDKDKIRSLRKFFIWRFTV